jgi:hypothetical protein
MEASHDVTLFGAAVLFLFAGPALAEAVPAATTLLTAGGSAAVVGLQFDVNVSDKPTALAVNAIDVQIKNYKLDRNTI